MADKVVIVSYDPEWPELFARLAASLREVLGDVALRIDHIGSTSIPGLAAKPVIDVQISVLSLEPLDAFRIPIESVGFVFRDNNPDLTKRYFREREGKRRTHIHVRRLGIWAEQSVLLFRDFMRAHAKVAKRYAALKVCLAEEYRDDRAGYTDAKSPFIWKVLAEANTWSQETGWAPGPSDA